MSKFFITIIFNIVITSFALAQNGTIRGTVTDAANGEPLFGVNVLLEGTTNGAVTDFDGKFEIKTNPGTHNLIVSFVTYSKITIQNVVVKSGEVTIIDNLSMKEDVEQLGEVVVTAKALRTNEAALLTIKRKSSNLVDGISAANFRKIGDANAAGAVKRVTGVSVEDGKYVYVRGLGDRYTKTMLNSMDIPGLDPDRNSLQIDIFPTNLIDNMIVLKSALAEMPADFTGGIVNIETKEFPEERILDVSLKVSYNPSMHFNNNFLSYEGSETDWLGYSSEVREIPTEPAGGVPLPFQATDQEVFDFANSFNPTLGASTNQSLMDYSLGVTTGNQKAFNNGNKLGYIFSANYKSNTVFYDNIIYGEYEKPGQELDRTELITATVQRGQQAERSILLGGLAGVAFKTRNSKYRLTGLHLQNGETTSAQFSIVDDPEDLATGKSGFSATSDNLAYSQRGLTNLLLGGEHYTNDNSWSVDWRVSSTFSNIEDPDIRKTAFSLSQNDPILSAGQAGLPSRIWRYLDEVNLVGKVDVTKNLELFKSDAKIKFGGSYVFKERDFKILSYQMAFFGSQPDWSGDPNDILQDDNLFPNQGRGYFQSLNNDPNPNEFNSTVDNIAGYVSTEISPFSNFKTILGLRAEKFVQRHTGRDITWANENFEEGNNLDNDIVLDELNFFPSLNFIYNLTDQQNIRFSYSKTIARPSFKEMSFAQILDPISNRTFNGGLFPYSDWDGNLRSTLIDNIDLRWEMYLKRNELFSAGLFYKSFQDPIEIVRISSAQTTNEFQPRNVGDSRAFGAEVEFRKSLDFISPILSNLSLSGNFTYTKSILTMADNEFRARKRYQKPGQSIDNTREMAGQAPYVINTGFTYDNIDKKFEAGLFYNVQGPTLIFVGGSLFPDVFSEPFHSLNFNLNKRFGEEEKFSINISVDNILNDVREEFYKAFQSTDQYFSRRAPGTSFGIGVGYSF